MVWLLTVPLKGSGELDNGWTFDLTIAHATMLDAYSCISINHSTWVDLVL